MSGAILPSTWKACRILELGCPADVTIDGVGTGETETDTETEAEMMEARLCVLGVSLGCLRGIDMSFINIDMVTIGAITAFVLTISCPSSVAGSIRPAGAIAS